MLKTSLYFVTKSTLPLQISKNSEADLGSMQHLGCNSWACGNSSQVKTVNYCHKELGLRYCRDHGPTSESYSSNKYFSTRTPQTNGSFLKKKQILLTTRRSASFFISLIQLLEKFIWKYERKSVGEHRTKM